MFKGKIGIVILLSNWRLQKESTKRRFRYWLAKYPAYCIRKRPDKGILGYCLQCLYLSLYLFIKDFGRKVVAILRRRLHFVENCPALPILIKSYLMKKSGK